MASKRKRRRQAARKEALRLIDKEKKAVAEVTTPAAEKQVAKVYRDYRVAVQKKPTDPVYVITVREHDQSALMAFIARMQEVSSVKDLAFLEVHLQLSDGKVGLIHEAGDWPKDAKVIHNTGFVVRGKDRALTVPATKPKQSTPVTKTTAVVTPIIAKPPLPAGMYEISSKRYKTSPLTL